MSKTEAEKLDEWRAGEAITRTYARDSTAYAEYRRLVREDIRPPEPKTLEQRLLEEAPKDGAEIVAHDQNTGTSNVTFWDGRCWHDPDDHYYSEAPEFNPTHFRPLPSPPEQREGDEG